MMDFNIVLFYGVPAKNLICKLAKNLQCVSIKLTGSYYSSTVYYEPVNLVETPCTLTDT